MATRRRSALSGPSPKFLGLSTAQAVLSTPYSRPDYGLLAVLPGWHNTGGTRLRTTYEYSLILPGWHIDSLV